MVVTASGDADVRDDGCFMNANVHIFSSRHIESGEPVYAVQYPASATIFKEIQGERDISVYDALQLVRGALRVVDYRYRRNIVEHPRVGP